MKCPFCGNEDTQVKDSRSTEDNSAIRRRRFCLECGARFTTYERVQLRELVRSLKTSGKREGSLERRKVGTLYSALQCRNAQLSPSGWNK